MNFDKDPAKIPIIEKEKKFNSLFRSDDFYNLDNEEFIKEISLLVDFSLDLKRIDGLEDSIEKLEFFLERDLTFYEKALGHYFLANAYSNKRYLHIKVEDAISKWENIDIEKEILNFRFSLKYFQLAINDDSFAERTEEEIFHYKIRQCQIYTNLGNLMDNVGRFAEGIEYRNKAISINPKFGMAIGTKGMGYSWYSRYLYDPGHQSLFLHTAYHLLKSSLKCQLEYGADTAFQNTISYIEDIIEEKYLNKKIYLYSFSLGNTDEEIKYRDWCLKNCLFLNPLNDIGPYPIAANDVLSLPYIITKIEEGPNCQILYNLLKQEFVSARYLYYKGISEKNVHFSDKDVFLYNTEDYPVHSKASEDIKNSFRVCYSILDKIAFFLNYYLGLEIDDKKIYFKSLWYENEKMVIRNKSKEIGKRGNLKPNIIQKTNLPLLGLFWISKDLFEEDIEFIESLEPDGKEWYTIRNHLEHKFLKLQIIEDENFNINSEYLGEIDKSLTYSIGIHDFESKSLKLLKTVRAALIYLVLAMRYEEIERDRKRDKNANIAQISLQKFPDELKINDYIFEKEG